MSEFTLWCEVLQQRILRLLFIRGRKRKSVYSEEEEKLLKDIEIIKNRLKKLSSKG